MIIFCCYQGEIEVEEDFDCSYCDECDFCTDNCNTDEDEN